MSIDLADYKSGASEAVRVFWGNRQAARQKQIDGGRADQGERAGVTAGKNMDGFLSLATEVVKANGLANAEICLNRSVLTLPGYFRSTKIWDLLVINEGRLIAALEFKSHIGPSFGNNFNNRTEEAIGMSLDLRTAIREGALGDHALPFLGWLILVEDCQKSRAPVKNISPHFPVFPEFKGASYAERYDILCRKLVLEQLYTSAALLMSPRGVGELGEFSEISESTSLKIFISMLASHVAAEVARSTSD